LTRTQWAGVARRTPTYLRAYRDAPGSLDRAQQRADWLGDRLFWGGVGSVLEAGCGCGRNLAVLRRRYPSLRLLGADICPQAVGETRAAVPDAQVALLDLYDVPAWPTEFTADIVLTSGSLCHVEPTALPGVLRALVARAKLGLVLLEHFEADGVGGRCLKGPKAWHPALRATGEGYCLWSIAPGKVFGSLWDTFERRGWAHRLVDVPKPLQAPGATRLLVLGAFV
jgi:SAM-dependent methyltransferase